MEPSEVEPSEVEPSEVEHSEEVGPGEAEQPSAWCARLLQQAQRKTGLTDLGHRGYAKFLAASLADVERNGNLTRLGRALYGQNVVRCTAARLQLIDLVDRHPENRSIEVASPILVTGLYRSGTTLLHRLLSTSASVDAPLFWQLIGVGSDQTDAKKLRSARWSRRIHRLLSPGFEDAHEILADDVEECFHLFEFCAPTSPYWMTAAQEHARWMLDPAQAADMVAAYEFYKLQLQVLSWRHGLAQAPARWLLKWPYHLWHLGALRAVFPDVRVIVCRRDFSAAGFEKTVASICSLASHGLRPFTGRLDAKRHGAFWWEQCEVGVRRFKEQRGAFGDQLRAVRFEDLCAQPLEIALGLTDWLDIQRPSPSAVPQLEQRRRKHHYSAADYGLPP